MKNRTLGIVATLAVALAACGGSGNSPPPQQTPSVTVKANADAFTAVTGVEQTFDVLANDTGGGLTVTDVQAASGDAAVAIVDGRQVRYRAPCCTATSDRFTYSIRGTDGATSAADAMIAIERRLAVTARASDLGTVTAASVTVGTGAPRALEIRADGTVAFTLDFVEPDALVVLRMQRDARFGFVGVAGSVDDLGAIAGNAASVSFENVPALELSTLSTTIAGTVASEIGGALPTRGLEWRARVAALTDWDGIAGRAHFLDGRLAGESLPDGTTLVELAFDPVRAEVLRDNRGFGSRATMFPENALGGYGAGAGVYWLYRGGTGLDDLAVQLLLSSSGEGRLTGPAGERTVRWTNTTDALVLENANPTPGDASLFGFRLANPRGCRPDLPQPALVTWSTAFFPSRVVLQRLLLSAPRGVAAALVGRVEGFILSPCVSLVGSLRGEPELAFEVAFERVSAQVVPPLEPGRWLLPYVKGPRDGRAPRHFVADVVSSTQAVGPNGQPIMLRPQPQGTLIIEYPGVGTVEVHTARSYGQAIRTVVESTLPDGTRTVSEGWLARVDDGLALAARMRSVRLTGCCRKAQLLPIAFDAQGAAAFEDPAGLQPITGLVQSPSGALRVPIPGTTEGDLAIVPIVAVDARRYLSLATRGSDRLGFAQVITLL